MFWNKKKQQNQIILCNSWPKAGTHLLLEMASIILGNKKEWYNEKDIKVRIEDINNLSNQLDDLINKYQKNFAIKGHIGYSKEVLDLFKRKKIKVLFIIRDPRDVICSTVRWVVDLRKNWEAHTYFKTLTKEQQISIVIKGLPNIEPFVNEGTCLLWNKPLKERYQNLTSWSDCLDVCVLKYEELSGNYGENLLSQSINEVLRFLEISDEKIEKRIKENIVNKNSRTFHSGKSGGWKTEFSKKNAEEFINSGGEELVKRFGYPPTEDVFNKI